MVCKNCGREFEGTFCPSCGTKAEGALPVCPVCGAPHAAGDLFCPRCGYDYRRPSASVPMAGTAAPQAVHNAPAVRPAPPVQPAQPAEAVPEAAPAAQSAPPVPPAPASKAKLYGLLRYASAALLGLYAVLLFAFYAAPLASVFWSALGSVYDFKVFEGLKTASIGIVLIVFGVLTAVAAAVLALIGKKTVRGKKFCIFQKSISAEWLFAGVACAVPGRVFSLPSEACRFGEKDSIFLREKIAVIGAELKFKYSFPDEIERRRCYFRLKRASLPKGRSMGCVFVNPEEESAGALIERCGLKGVRIGEARVSEVHANFILNEGGSSADVSALIALVKERVERETGVVLREEVRRLP